MQAGTRLGPYEILAPLGAGGMGQVFRARDKKLDRDVAIKVLPETVASDPDSLARFEREAKAVAALSHPNILSIFDFGVHDGVSYAAMELLEGETLRGKLDASPIPQKQAVEYALQIARGLSAAHEKGIVHRDLKPENLFVSKDGHLKILDFGLAKRTEPDKTDDVTSAPTASKYTEPGMLMGTVSYMSPEQVRGLSVDHRSDVFSFGAILYELLSGKKAFKRETAADTMSAILKEEPPDLSESGRSISPALDHVVKHCLEKDLSNRFQHAKDIVFALSEASVSVPTGRISGAVSTRSSLARIIRISIALVAILVGVLALMPTVREKAALVLNLRRIPAVKRLAILPFRSASTTEEDRALADGVSDLLTVRLTQLERFQKALLVEPTSNVRRSGVTSADTAARSLGATLVVSGGVRRLGERLVFTGNLDDAQRNRALRAESAETLEELIEKVVRMLDLELGPEAEAALRASGTNVAEAAVLSAQALGFTPYSEGRTALERRDQAASIERAIELFNRALERDPKYALAHAGLGEAYWRLYRVTRKVEYVALARQQCERALALDGLLAPAWVALGIIDAGTGHAEEAIADLKQALDRDPRSAQAYSELSLAYERMNRLKEAEATARRAIELRPDSWSGYSYLGYILASHGRSAEAEGVYEQALELALDNARLWLNLGAALYYQGRSVDARKAFARSVALSPSPQAVSNLATLQFGEGLYAEAAQTLERAAETGTRDYRVWRNLGAALYWARGKSNETAAAFRKAVELAEQERRIDPKDPETLLLLADCYAMLSDSIRSRALVVEGLGMGPVRPVLTNVAAGVYETLGDRTEALRWIGVALKDGLPLAEIESDPTFKDLITDRRYLALADTVKPKSTAKANWGTSDELPRRRSSVNFSGSICLLTSGLRPAQPVNRSQPLSTFQTVRERRRARNRLPGTTGRSQFRRQRTGPRHPRYAEILLTTGPLDAKPRDGSRGVSVNREAFSSSRGRSLAPHSVGCANCSQVRI